MAWSARSHGWVMIITASMSVARISSGRV